MRARARTKVLMMTMMKETKMKAGLVLTFVAGWRAVLVGVGSGWKCKFYQTNPIWLFPKLLFDSYL